MNSAKTSALRTVGLLTLSSVLAACATQNTRTNPVNGDADVRVTYESENNNDQARANDAISALIRQNKLNQRGGLQPVSASGPLVVDGQPLKHQQFDLPVVVNPKVEFWINYFTGKGRKYFEKYLARGRYFIPAISKILKANNMPQDLVYLAMMESGFNNIAKSHAKAVGPWQFIKPTGVRYGMVVDYWLDERRDTKRSTMAAIAYLRELQQEFGSWELAFAGYNAGENKVRRAIMKYRVNDFWELSKYKFFRPETRDYVPKIFAAAILTKNAEMFGFVSPLSKTTKNYLAGISSDSQGDDLAEDVTPKELGEPQEVATDDTVADEKTELAVTDEGVEADEEEDVSAAVTSISVQGLTPSVYMVANPNEQIGEFEIKGPADLFAVAKASGLAYSTVKMLNPELRRWCTPPSLKTYRIKLPMSVRDRFLATYNDDSFDKRVLFSSYVVQRGDTVQKVAQRFRLEPQAIRDTNRLSSFIQSLRVGSEIQLPLPVGYKRMIASQYDDQPELPGRKKRKRIFRRRRAHAAILKSRAGGVIRTRVRPKVAVYDRD